MGDLNNAHTTFQNAALKDYYNMLAANEKKLGQIDYVRFTLIPRIVFLFVFLYWVIGLGKYSQII